MSHRKRRFLSTLLALVTLAATVFFWESNAILVPLLALAGAGIVYLNWRKDLLFVYVFGFVCGPLAEAAAISTGAWSYASPDLLGFPLWLPFLWGNAAVFIAIWRPHMLNR